MSSSSSLYALFSSGLSLVNVACQIGLLVVVAGAVRRHRPDAYKGLLVWAIAALALSVVMPALHSLVNVVVGRSSGIDAILLGQAAVASFGAVGHIALVIILARGLVRLAEPPKPVVVDSGAAYR